MAAPPGLGITAICVSLSPSSSSYWDLTDTCLQNFSKFLIKNGKVQWFPARSTKVVSWLFVLS